MPLPLQRLAMSMPLPLQPLAISMPLPLKPLAMSMPLPLQPTPSCPCLALANFLLNYAPSSPTLGNVYVLHLHTLLLCIHRPSCLAPPNFLPLPSALLFPLPCPSLLLPLPSPLPLSPYPLSMPLLTSYPFSPSSFTSLTLHPFLTSYPSYPSFLTTLGLHVYTPPPPPPNLLFLRLALLIQFLF
jgi:hypothetical protein